MILNMQGLMRPGQVARAHLSPSFPLSQSTYPDVC